MCVTVTLSLQWSGSQFFLNYFFSILSTSLLTLQGNNKGKARQNDSHFTVPTVIKFLPSVRVTSVYVLHSYPLHNYVFTFYVYHHNKYTTFCAWYCFGFKTSPRHRILLRIGYVLKTLEQILTYIFNIQKLLFALQPVNWCLWSSRRWISVGASVKIVVKGHYL